MKTKILPTPLPYELSHIDHRADVLAALASVSEDKADELFDDIGHTQFKDIGQQLRMTTALFGELARDLQRRLIKKTKK